MRSYSIILALATLALNVVAIPLAPVPVGMKANGRREESSALDESTLSASSASVQSVPSATSVNSASPSAHRAPLLDLARRAEPTPFSPPFQPSQSSSPSAPPAETASPTPAPSSSSPSPPSPPSLPLANLPAHRRQMNSHNADYQQYTVDKQKRDDTLEKRVLGQILAPGENDEECSCAEAVDDEFKPAENVVGQVSENGLGLYDEPEEVVEGVQRSGLGKADKVPSPNVENGLGDLFDCDDDEEPSKSALGDAFASDEDKVDCDDDDKQSKNSEPQPLGVNLGVPIDEEPCEEESKDEEHHGIIATGVVDV